MSTTETMPDPMAWKEHLPEELARVARLISEGDDLALQITIKEGEAAALRQDLQKVKHQLQEAMDEWAGEPGPPIKTVGRSRPATGPGASAVLDNPEAKDKSLFSRWAADVRRQLLDSGMDRDDVDELGPKAGVDGDWATWYRCGFVAAEAVRTFLAARIAPPPHPANAKPGPAQKQTLARWLTNCRQALAAAAPGLSSDAVADAEPWTRWYNEGKRPKDAVTLYLVKAQDASKSQGLPPPDPQPGETTDAVDDLGNRRTGRTVFKVCGGETYKLSELFIASPGLTWEKILASTCFDALKKGEPAQIPAPLDLRDGYRYSAVGSAQQGKAQKLVRLYPTATLDLARIRYLKDHPKDDLGPYCGRSCQAPDGTQYVVGPAEDEIFVTNE